VIPQTLKIKGHTYKVNQVGRKELGTGFTATVDNEANIIQLFKRSSPSRKVECLIHEALHAMLAGYGYEHEEDIVVTLGEALTEFIKANPSFIRHALKVLGQG
jgi:hypothetical protein